MARVPKPRPEDSTSNGRASVPPVDPILGNALTPMAFAHAIVRSYERYGVDPSNALRLARIPKSQIDKTEMRVTANQIAIMSATAMEELDDEGLGWYSRKLPWGTHGMLCRASICSPNLLIALKRWCRQLRLLTDNITLTLSVDGPTAMVEMTLEKDRVADVEMCIMKTLRNVLAFSCWAIDSKIPLISLRLAFPPPPHAEFYPMIFACPVEFDTVTAGLRFDARYLSMPIRRDERDTVLMLKRMAISLIVFQYRRDRLLVQRLRTLLRTGTDKSCCTAEMLADHLHISTRTLHRQLHEEGASLLQIKNEARRDRAIHLLTQTTQSIKQIARIVGFDNEKSFSRAFKQWTGNSPNAFRDFAVDKQD